MNNMYSDNMLSQMMGGMKWAILLVIILLTASATSTVSARKVIEPVPTCNGLPVTIHAVITGRAIPIIGTTNDDVILVESDGIPPTDKPWVYGDDGNDTICIQTDDAIVWGGAGDDWIKGGSSEDWIKGQHGRDTIYGGGGNDVIWGGGGDDILYGGTGNDQMKGDEDNDILYGDAGDDQLTGDKGIDQLNCGDGIDYGQDETPAVACEHYESITNFA